MTAMEIEFTGLELSPAVFGKFGDESVFSGNDRGGVECRRAAGKTKLPCPFQNAKPVRGLQKRLAGHAASQNAKPADLFAAFDYSGFEAEAHRCSGCGISRTSATDHRKVVVHRGIIPVLPAQEKLKRLCTERALG